MPERRTKNLLLPQGWGFFISKISPTWTSIRRTSIFPKGCFITSKDSQFVTIYYSTSPRPYSINILYLFTGAWTNGGKLVYNKANATARGRLFMQKQVLSLLKQTDGYLSGEEISRQLGVSRAAVWKAVKALREKGYGIDSVTNRGYCLSSQPDLLDATAIQSGLSTHFLGRNIVVLEETDSTNEEAKRQGAAGAPDGTLCLAERQTGGKGRLGRSWSSPPGAGVWMSLLLRPQLAPQEATLLTLIAGLSVCRAIRRLTGCGAMIKWPNDIVIGRKKVCGILTELAADMEQIHYVVVGIGVNANLSEFEGELKKKATSLLLETGEKIDRAALIRAVLEEFEACYDRFVTDLTADFITPYEELCVSLNRQVSVIRGGREITGQSIGLSKEGELLIHCGDWLRGSHGTGDLLTLVTRLMFDLGRNSAVT